MTNSHNIDEKIELVPFDSHWKEIYKTEELRIKNKLKDQIIEMQHIGSTAIPNIYSKPIIDIMIGIENLEKNKLIVSSLIELGYEYLGTANVPGRHYFRNRGINSFNIALCQHQGDIWNNNILFRDMLLNDPDAAAAYSVLKKNAYDSGVKTLLNYSDKKHPFIEETIKKGRLKSEKK